MAFDIYEFSATNIDGEEISMADFAGKLLLIVNVASKSGYTDQYKELEELYQNFKTEKFVVLGFPCNQFMNEEPGSDRMIKEFVIKNYGVTFPMFSKIKAKGSEAHPLFKFLSESIPGVQPQKAVKYSFTKFLVNRYGKPIKRYPSSFAPNKIAWDVEKRL